MGKLLGRGQNLGGNQFFTYRKKDLVCGGININKKVDPMSRAL